MNLAYTVGLLLPNVVNCFAMSISVSLQCIIAGVKNAMEGFSLSTM